MRRWKVDKKYIVIAGLALIIILVALVFNNLLEQGSKYDEIRTTISNTMLPIIAGFILAYLLNPVMKCTEKYIFTPLAKHIFKKKDKERKQKKLSRSLGVITTMALFMLLLIGGFCLVIPQIYVSVAKIVEEVPAYYGELEKLANSFIENDNELSKYILGLLDTAYVQGMEYVNTVVLPNIDKILKGITTGIIGGIKTTFNVVLAIIISIYVLFEKENLISYGKKLTYSYLKRKHANMLIKGVRYVNMVFGGFINGKIIDSFIIGILCYIFMLVAGFEYAVLISIIVGITNVIPYFGPFIGAIPSILILLMTEPKQGLIFAVFILILQQLDGNVIGPLILGDRLKISSMWILIAILIGGGLFGVAGMILGAPTLACIYALLGKDTRRRLEKKELPVESGAYLFLDRVNEEMKVEYFNDTRKEE
ncbi:MAG: AI-2E family transporter [Lachnospiraceae bacterium]|nr:AI-2E family transporter [Lachnospiraceae bacterium]